MVELTLKMGNKERTFTAPFISARMLRRTIEIGQQVDQRNIKPEAVDRMVDYIVELFGKQFTRDAVYDGLEARKWIPTIMAWIREVTGQLNEATGRLGGKNERRGRAKECPLAILC